MKTSKVLLASIFLTAVILAVVGGFVSNAMAQRMAASSPNQSTAADGTVDPAVFTEREAAYQQTIEQANQQLTQANQQLQEMQTRLNQLQEQPAGSAAVIPSEQAARAAREAAGAGQVERKPPELVSFDGRAAYEVVFDAGSIYVDAQSGALLFNATQPQNITAEQAAQIASDYLGIKDILSVDQINFRGAPLWRVIFKNSTIAYLDLTGQITYVLNDSYSPQDVQVSSSSDNSSSNSSSHEFDDHHEDEHDDD